MAYVTISSKNRIVIPREAREALGLKPGDKLIVVAAGGRIVAIQKPKSYRKALRGAAQGSYDSDYLPLERNSWD